MTGFMKTDHFPKIIVLRKKAFCDGKCIESLLAMVTNNNIEIQTTD